MTTARVITPTEKIRGRNVEITPDANGVQFNVYVEVGEDNPWAKDGVISTGPHPIFYFDGTYLGLNSFESEAEARQGVRSLLRETESHRVWCNDNGRVTCYDHGGDYLQSHVDYYYHDDEFDTALDNWADFTDSKHECEDCRRKGATRG